MQRLFALLSPEEINSILPVLRENLRNVPVFEDPNQWSWLFPYFRSNSASGSLVFSTNTPNDKLHQHLLRSDHLGGHQRVHLCLTPLSNPHLDREHPAPLLQALRLPQASQRRTHLRYQLVHQRLVASFPPPMIPTAGDPNSINGASTLITSNI